MDIINIHVRDIVVVLADRQREARDPLLLSTVGAWSKDTLT